MPSTTYLHPSSCISNPFKITTHRTPDNSGSITFTIAVDRGGWHETFHEFVIFTNDEAYADRMSDAINTVLAPAPLARAKAA